MGVDAAGSCGGPKCDADGLTPATAGEGDEMDNETQNPFRWQFDGKDLKRIWHEWKYSQEGKECLSGPTVGIYLENRLQRAFAAGMEAALTLKKKEAASTGLTERS